MNSIQYKKIIKFVAIGGVVAVFNIVLLFILVNAIHVYYLLASALSFIFAFVLNFVLQKYWAFKGAPDGKVMKQIFLFITLVGLNFIINLLFMFLFVEKFGIQYLLAQIFTTIILGGLNFLVYQKFIFRKN